MSLNRAFFIILSVCIFVSCQEQVENEKPINTDVNSSEETNYTLSENEKLRAVADSILYLIESKNFEELNNKFGGFENSEDHKIIFSPYAYIDSAKHQKIKISDFQNENMELVWGYMDGSGEEIRLSPPQYIKQYILKTKFSMAPSVNVNLAMGRGNSLDNTAKYFPDSEFVEFYFPMFEEQYEGLDWQSLRVFIKKIDGRYKLIGLVNDRWTI